MPKLPDLIKTQARDFLPGDQGQGPKRDLLTTAAMSAAGLLALFTTVSLLKNRGFLLLAIFCLLFFLMGYKKPKLLCYLWLFVDMFYKIPRLNYFWRGLEKLLSLSPPLFSPRDIFYTLFILVFILKSGLFKRGLSSKNLEPASLVFTGFGVLSIGVGFLYEGEVLVSDFRLFLYSLMIPAVAYTFDSPKKVKQLIKVVFLFTAAAAVLGFPFLGPENIKLQYIESVERKITFYGLLLGAGLAFDKAWKTRWRIMGSLGGILLLGLFLVNKSRKYYYALVFTALAGLVTKVLNPKKTVLLFLAFTLVVFLVPPFRNSLPSLASRFKSPISKWGRAKGLNWRLFSLKESLSRFGQGLFLGQGTSRHIGSRTYISGFIEKGVSEKPYNEIIFHEEAPHNLFLTVFQTGGLLGLGLFIYITARVLVSGCKSYLKQKERQFKTTTFFLIMGVLTSLFILSVERLMILTIMEFWFFNGLLLTSQSLQLLNRDNTCYH